VLSNVPDGVTAVGIPARVVSRSDKKAETAQLDSTGAST